MKSFKSYLTPEEQIKELSLTEKAWAAAKQKIAENKELNLEEQALIDKFLGIEPAYEPDDGPLTESQVEQIQESVQYQLVTGPQGEQGPQGIPGEKGDKGDQGEQGIPGIQGERGERGERGLAGLNGLRGEKGDQGIQGERGEQGPQGNQGEQGVAGQNGKDGEKGDQGIQGVAGRDGVDGKDGAPGPKGDKGDRGEKGQDGKNGQDGKDGRDGKDGAKGDKGDRGEKGDKGDKGDKGEDGETPDIKPFAEKFNKLSLDINKKVGRIASDMGALASGGGSGSYWLNDLGDTNYASIVNATDQQVLTFDAASGKWIAADATGGGANVGTLQQVTTQGNTTTRGITTTSVQMNLTAGVTVTTGQMAWNAQDLTVDVGMANGVTLQLGQEQYIKVKASENITDGEAVMFAGADGEHILAARCNTAVSGFKPEWFIGVATQTLTRNGFGYITTFGKVHDINTLAFQEGDILYVDANTVGGLSNTAPTLPRPQITVAAVTKRAGGDGHILVRPTFETNLMIDTHQLTDLAFNQANAAFLKANTPSYTANSASSYANSAFIHANAAFDYANTLTSGSSDQWARTQANSAFLQANTPSYTANSASSYANSAFIKANAAFDYANTITFTTDPSAGSYANSAFNTANAAFLQANTPSYTSNSAASYANSAFTVANNASSNTVTLQGVNLTQNTNITLALNTANAAFMQANTPSNVANSAASYANSAFTVANNAFTTTNGSIAWATANSAGSYANAAFLKANTPDHVGNSASSYANSAFLVANSAFTSANGTIAWNTANAAFLQANTPSYVANSAASYANSAFAKANTAITTSGGSITGQLNVTYTPATTVNAAIQISAANTLGGTGYADVLRFTNTSGGATLPNKTIRMNNLGAIEIIDSNYGNNIFNLSDSGDLTLKGGLTINGINAGYAPNRPAFRVYGANTTSISATNTLNYNNWAIEYNQGSYLNNTTGIFTAPVAGLYQVNLIARSSGAATIHAIQVQKTSGGTTTTQIYIEWGASSSAYHMGGSSVVKMAVGDTLKTIVTSGTVTFDANDCWSVAYLG